MDDWPVCKLRNNAGDSLLPHGLIVQLVWTQRESYASLLNGLALFYLPCGAGKEANERYMSCDRKKDSGQGERHRQDSEFTVYGFGNDKILKCLSLDLEEVFKQNQLS